MIVILDESLFSSSRAPLELNHFFRLGSTGRHRVQVDPLYEPDADRPINRWLERQDPRLRDEVILALELGMEEAAHGVPSDQTVRVAPVDSPDWDIDPPCLPLEQAGRILQQPLKLILENERHDRAFLETVALRPWRERLEKAIAEKHLEPRHGGGLTEMKAKVESPTASRSDRLLRWFLFDSDALEPGKPSRDSQKLRDACETNGYRYHQLQRRASENYLPPQALNAWAYSSSRSQRRQRRAKAEAFAKMEPTQRHHFNMKKGFAGDKDRGIPDLFGRLPKKPELRSGFGQDIAKLYLDPEFRILDDWLIRDAQTEETKELLQAIFRAL